jgi:hypothetical protein
VAIRGANPYFGLKRGHIIINGGHNSWKDDPNGSQYYLTRALPYNEIAAILESYMKHDGANKK